MEKLDKPNFFSTQVLLNIVTDIFGILGFIQLFLPVWSWKIKLTTLIISIFISTFFAVLKYITEVNKFYKNYTKLYQEYSEILEKHTALSSQFDSKSYTIKSQNDLLIGYKLVLDNILFEINQGTLPVNNYEKEYLKNLSDILMKNKVYLYNLEGGLENGKRNI